MNTPLRRPRRTIWLALASLSRPGWAELVCAALALACVALPAYWAERSGAEARRAELRTILQGRISGAEHSVRDWARRSSVRAARVVAEVAAEAERRQWDEATLRAELHRAARAARFDAATLGDPELLRTADELRLRGEPPVVAWNRVEPGPFTWRFAVLAPLRSPDGEVRAAAFRLSDAPALARTVSSPDAFEDGGRLRLYHRESSWLGAAGCDDPPAKTLLRAGVRPARPERLRFNLSGYEDCSSERVVGAWSDRLWLGFGVLAEIPFKEAYRSETADRRALLFAALLIGLLLVALVSMQTGTEAAEGSRRSAPRRRSSAAWGILAVSVLATLVAWVTASSRSDAYEEAAFRSAVAALQGQLADLLRAPERTVTAAASALEALGPERLDEWTRFVDSLTERGGRWALCQVGFAPLGEQAFVVRTVSDACGQSPCRDEQSDCRLRQLRNAGRLDAALDPHVRADEPVKAFPVSSHLGEIALVRSVWVDDSDHPTGWIVGLVSIDALAAGLAGRAGEIQSFRLYDAPEQDEPVLLYASPGADDDVDQKNTSESLPLELGGRSFLLEVARSGSTTPHLARSYPAQVLLAGLAISVLLFDIALVLSSTRERALGIADLMTRRYRDGEERVRAVIDNAYDGIITFDPRGVISTFNPAAERLFGYRKEEVSELRFPDLLPSLPQDAEVARSGALVSARRKDRSRFPAEVSVSTMQLDGKPYYTAVVRDISARVQAEEKLRESEERYALAARGANDGLWDWNLRTDEIYFSDRWKAMIGVERDQIGTQPDEWFNRVHREDIDGLRSRLRRHLAAETPHFESEHRIQHSSGGFVWVLSRGIAVRDENGSATRIAGSLTDITDRKRTERRLRYDALHDPLTGLPNRTYFIGQLERARDRARLAGGEPFGLLFLDIDRFKVVNDSLGHLVGDQLLIGISERLKSCVRPGDTICRLGGDEFAILVEALQEETDVVRVAERIQQALRRPMVVDRHEVFSTVSIGIAISSSGSEAPEELLRDADTAMYRAKSAGRARFEMFQQPMHAAALDLLQLDTDLRRAVERDQLVLHYQPIVDLRKRRITCCEALVRWRHPERGLLGPAEFIPLAEESGVIEDVTGWLLREAGSRLVAWRRAGLPPVAVSVNISPRQLQRQDISGLVLETLREFDLPASAFQLELTETALMEGSEAATRPLRELRRHGVRVSLDDFGTGYSSLAYLRRFPIHAIKIDQSFIRMATEDDGSAAIVSGLIGLAHSLNLEVVAEGVESGAQLEYLIDCNCDLVQGFVVSPGVEADRFEDLLAASLDLDALLEQPRVAS